MIKAILFDIDGIIIRRDRYFSDKFAESKGIPIEKVTEFFKGEFKNASFGRADLKDIIVPWLPKWGWDGTVDEFLDKWFKDESTTDPSVLSILDRLRKSHLELYIATRQELHRKNYLWENVGLKNYFDGVFCTCDIGVDKDTLEFFEYCLKELSLDPEEVMFFDDSEGNVRCARKLGINAYYYEQVEDLTDALEFHDIDY